MVMKGQIYLKKSAVTDKQPHKDDYVDKSQWDAFFNDSVVFYNSIVIEIMIKDLMFELDERKKTDEIK